LVRFLATHPDQLYSLNPRKFEELVEAIFRDFGYDVILTPKPRDGGFDVRAIRKDSVGTLLYLIECKRFSPHRPVGPEIIRSLYGVVEQQRASCGLLVTTSRFTKGAKEEARKNGIQVGSARLPGSAGLVETISDLQERRLLNSSVMLHSRGHEHETST
jgi:HJR/Mrr/RecB family endonuclease